MLGPIFTGVQGTELSLQEINLLKNPLIGGVVLFARNVSTPEQLLALTASIKALRTPQLLIAVDQEGGRVARLREGFTDLPNLQKIGEIYADDPELGLKCAREMGWLLATEVLSVGIDISFAPVLDLNIGNTSVIGNRSFAASPQVVTVLAGAMVDGMAEAGMPGATGKHYPGHGYAKGDSHHTEPVDERPYETIKNNDLVPYARLVHLRAVMSAHVIYPAVDIKPASFSEKWLQQILRSELGFQGIVFSDDLDMAGAKSVGSLVQRIQACLQAGNDIALICNEFAELARTLLELAQLKVPADLTGRLENLRGLAKISYAELSQHPRCLAARKLIEQIQFASTATTAL